MKINKVSTTNQSFKALMLEKPENGLSVKQREIIDIVKNRITEDIHFVNLLENKHSDIYLSPNKDGDSVDLKIRTAAGLTYNYIPVDNKGLLKTRLFFPETNKISEFRRYWNMDIRVTNFLNRAINCFYKNFNSKNTDIERAIEYISEQDMSLKKHYLIKYKLLPDAKTLLGVPQVETKDYLKKHNYI